MPEEDRQRLLRVVSQVALPDRGSRRKLRKEFHRRKQAEQEKRLEEDRRLLADTGIRSQYSTRQLKKPEPPAPFETPPRLPGANVTGASAPADDGAPRLKVCAELLHLQGRVRPAAPPLRRDVPPLRGAELGEAVSIVRPHRPLRTLDRGAGEDRLPGGAQAAPRGRAHDRHHPLPARRGKTVPGRAGQRRLARPPRAARPGPAAHAERRGAGRSPGRHAPPARLYPEQCLPDGPPPPRLLLAPDGR